MTRKALPQNYLLDAGTLLEDFEDNTTFTITNGTKAANTSEYKTGAKSMKVTANSGASCFVDKTISVVGIGDNVGLWVYCHTVPATTISYVNIKFTAVENFSNLLSYSYLAASLNLGWNYIPIHATKWTATGMTPGDAMIKIRITLVALEGQQPIISFDSLYIRQKRKAKIMFTFDGGPYESIYTEGFPYLAAKGMKGTIYITSTFPDTTGMCTLAQLEEMYAAGWALGNHTVTHPYFTIVSQAEIEDELTGCETWLNSNGFARASRHVAYPYGLNSEASQVAMTNCGMLTGRLVSDIHYATQTTPMGDYRLLRCYMFENTMTLAAVKTLVDTVERYGLTLCLLVHRLLSVAGDTATAITDFQALVDYIQAKNIDVVTIDEWYEGMTNPRYRSLPLGRATV